MILSMLLLFFMLLVISAAIFYLFCFFLPALKLKYEGISDSLATEMQFSDDSMKKPIPSDFSKIAFVEPISSESESKRLIYRGEKNCRLFHEMYRSEYENPKVCIGFGDCVKVCPQEAISIKNNCAVVNALCNGCGKCLECCPEHIISLVLRPKKSQENAEKGFKFWSACYKIINGGMIL